MQGFHIGNYVGHMVAYDRESLSTESFDLKIHILVADFLSFSFFKS